MVAISETEWAEYLALAELVFDPRVPDEERLPKIERVIELRERFNMPLEVNLFWVGRDGTHTRVTKRPYHNQAELCRERIAIRAAFAV